MNTLGRSKFIQSVSIGGILLFAVHFASAAPLCSGVFRDSYTVADTVKSLARMKLSGDLGKVKGEGINLGDQLSLGHYDQKLAELLGHFANPKDRQKILSAIKKEIAFLQRDLKKDSAKKDNRTKEEERVIERERRILQLPLKLEKKILLPLKEKAMRVTYAEAAESLVITTSTGITYRFGINDQSYQVLPEGMLNYILSHDQKTLFSVGQDKYTKTFILKTDLQNKSPALRVETSDWAIAGTKLDLSPNGTKLLGVRPRELTIVDVASGVVLKQIDTDFALVEAGMFLSENVLLLRFKDRLMRYNWKTGTNINVPIGKHTTYQNTSLTGNPKRLTLYENPESEISEVVVYDTSDLSVISRNPISIQRPYLPPSIYELPSDPGFFLTSTVRVALAPSHHIKIAYSRDLSESSFDFDLHYGQSIPFPNRILFPEVSFSKDGKQILIQSADGDNNVHIDFWKLD